MDYKAFFDLELQSNSKQKSAEIKRDLENTSKSVDKTKKKTKELGDGIEKTATRTAASTGKIDRRFKSTSKEATKMGKAVGGAGGGFKSLLASISPVQLGIAAVGAALIAGIKTFATFEQSVADLSAITGATGEDLKFYADAAREMGAVTTLSASEVADAFRLVASAKPDLLSNAEALKEVTAQAITLAEAAGISVPEAANTMASALNQFGAEADQAARFTNVLAAGSKFGAASIAEMGEALKFSGVISSKFGLSFEESNAALQLFSTSAIKGGEAGTQLRGVLLGLETKMSAKFRPSVVGMEQALINLRDANLSAEQSVKIFGSRNLVAGSILTGNIDKFKELKENITGTSIANEQAATKTDTLSGASKRFMSAVEELLLVITSDSGLGKALSFLVDVFAVLVTGIAKGIGGLIDLIKFLVDVTGVTKLLSTGMKFLKENLGGVSISLTDIATIIGGAVVKALLSVGQIFETVFEVATNSVNIARNKIIDFAISVVNLGKDAAPVLDIIFGTDSQGSIRDTTAALEATKTVTETTGQVVDRVGTKYSLLRGEVDLSTLATLDYSNKQKDLVTEKDDLAKALEDEIALEQAANKLREEAQKEIDAVTDSLEEEYDALLRTDKEQKIYNELVEAGVTADSEAGKQIIALIDKIDDKTIAIDAATEAEKEAAKAVDDLAKANEKAAKEIEDAWEDRRETLSDFFFEFAKDGMSAFDTLVEGFKSMIVKMIADAAANTIILGVTTAISGAATAGVAAGGMGPPAPAGSMTSQVSSAMSLLTDGFAAAGQGMYQSIGTGLSNLGLTGLGDMAYTKGLGTTGLTMAGDFAGGMAGAYLGEKVFGETTGIGSTVGGVVGSIVIPIPVLGAAIGSFVGTAIESLFTGDNNGDNRGRSTFDLSQTGGNISSFGEGKSFNQDNVDLAGVLSGSLLQISEMFGGSDLAGEIAIGNNTGITFKGESFGQDVDAFLFSATQDIIQGSDEIDQAVKDVVAAFEGTAGELAQFALTQIVIEDLIQGSEHLNASMEGLIRNFEGSTEDSLIFAQAMTNLSDILASNAVDDAALFAADAFAIAQDGVLGTYNSLTSAAVDAMVAYDGSAGSLSDLNNAMVMSKTAAFQLALEIGRLTESLVSMFAASAKSIREQLMTDDQLTAARTLERDTTLEAIKTMTNPENIAAAAKRVNELNNILFQELSEEDKKLFGADFAEFADEAAVIVKDTLDGTLALVEDSQEELMTSVGTLLNDTGKINRDAADILLNAATIILDAARTPTTVEVNVDTSGAVTG